MEANAMSGLKAGVEKVEKEGRQVLQDGKGMMEDAQKKITK